MRQIILTMLLVVSLLSSAAMADETKKEKAKQAASPARAENASENASTKSEEKGDDEKSKIETTTAAEGDDWENDDWLEEEEENTAPIEHQYSLERCLKLAEKNNKRIEAAHWEIVYADAKASEGWWAWWPRIEIKSVVTYSPSYNPDTFENAEEFLNYKGDELSIGGPVWGNEGRFTLPLYTFGKFTAYRELGKLGKQAARLKLAKAKERVAFEVKRAFYTLQFLEKMDEVLNEGIDYLSQAESKLDELLAKNSENVSEVDKFKFDVTRADILARKDSIERGKKVAVIALRTLIGLDKEQPFVLAKRFQKAETIEGEMGGFPETRDVMLENRTDFKLLRLNVDSKEVEVKKQRAYYFPDFFFDLQYRYIYAPGVKVIKNPFLDNPYNKHVLVAYIGFKYKFDLPLQVARARAAKAKLQKAKKERAYYSEMMNLEVKEAYESYLGKKSELQISDNALESGKKWLLTVLMNYNLGLTETSKMVEAIAAFFKTQIAYHSAMNEAHIAKAKLEWILHAQTEATLPAAENGATPLK